MTVDVAAERVEFVRIVLDTGKPAVVDGVIRGEGLRSVMRGLPIDDKLPERALLSFRPLDRIVQSEAADEWPTIIAKANDLGILSRLTPRETEVLSLIARGLSSHEVAFRLRRSRRTVDCHRAAISKKLDIHNVAELSVLASRAGLVHYSPGNEKNAGRMTSNGTIRLLDGILHPKCFSKLWASGEPAVA